jgi:aflatoxin B1 aldehyde reductase
MTFGPDESKGARITSLETYNQCLDYFQAQGYNEVDTARVYVGGKQEAFTAEAKWKDRGLTLATKVRSNQGERRIIPGDTEPWYKVYPSKGGEHKPANLRELFGTSLKELQTDQVDIFYLHAADRSVPFVETLEAVNELHKEGKFVRLGLSNFTAFEVAEVVITCKERGWVRPTIFQAMYNAISTFLPKL